MRRRLLFTSSAIMSMLVLSITTLIPATLAYRVNAFTCRYGCRVGIKAVSASGNRTLCKITDARRQTQPPNKKVQFYLPGHHDAKDCRIAWERRYN